MILVTLLAVMGLQDPTLTESNIDEMLASQLAETRTQLPITDMEGHTLVRVSLSGRTVTHDWKSRARLGGADIARLDRALLMTCDDELTRTALGLGVRLRHDYSTDGGQRLELNEASCSGVRLNSSPYWRTIQLTDTRLQAVDLRSVVEDGEALTFEMVAARPAEADKPDEAFRIYGYRLDCAEQTSSIQYVEAFDREGQSLEYSDTPTPVRPINAGTVMEAISDQICDGRSEDKDDRPLDATLQAAWARFDAAAS